MKKFLSCLPMAACILSSLTLTSVDPLYQATAFCIVPHLEGFNTANKHGKITVFGETIVRSSLLLKQGKTILTGT